MNIKLKKVVILCFVGIFASCQSSPSFKKESRTARSTERSIANTPLLRTFLREVADQTKRSAAREFEQQVQKRLKTFLMETASDGNPNYIRMGITKEQAMKIETLYDDLPYMNKVQKWVMENITVLVRDVQPSIARNAYNKILGRSGSLFDPYHGLNDDIQDLAMARRNQTKPGSLRRDVPSINKPKSVAEEIQSRNRRLIAATESLDNVDAKGKEYLLKNLKISDDLAKKNPLVASNIHHSIEGSLLITKKTGRRSLGPGCKSFHEKASGEILELKARVDIRRAELIEKRAYDKAGGVFNKVDDVPANKRLTESEIDELTEEAFEDVLGYSRHEAKAAIKRLKSPPCQVY